MRPQYHLDAYRASCDTSIVGVGEVTAEEATLFLADTVLYPEGGGQPADSGHLLVGDDELQAVCSGPAAEGFAHRVRGPGVESVSASTGAPCTVQLDWPRRFDHMQQHTAQHLLSAVAADEQGWVTTAFHLGEKVSDIELHCDVLGASQLEALEERVNELVREALPVRASWVRPDEMEGLGVRSRGLPEGHTGDVRLVEIEGVDRNTCGGTHLRSTSEIESVHLLGAEAMRGGCRLTWVAGARVRRRLAQHEHRLAELRATLEGADDELVGLARRKKEQVKESSQALRAAGDQLIELWVRRAIGGGEHALTLCVDPLGGAAAASAARALAAAWGDSPDARAALVTSAEGPFAVAGSTSVDVQTLGRELAEMWGARGGGRGAVFQGKAAATDSGRLRGREAEALALLRERLE